MSHFEDGTPYSYFDRFGRRESSLNVGWLDRERPFPTAAPSRELVEKLAWLVVNKQTHSTRGFHRCNLCAPPVDPDKPHFWIGRSGRMGLLGNGEIRVQGTHAVYAAPTLILHYVVDHAYRPPEDFVAGVLGLPEGLPSVDWSIIRARLK